MKLLYMNAFGYNFGDALALEIARRISGHPVRCADLWLKRRSKKNGVLTLGSIFHCAIDNDVIWGTGVHPVWQEEVRHQALDIRAVRGPLTRQYVQENLGVPCPEVYGDPALLMKRLFPKLQPDPVRKHGVVIHYNDIPCFQGEEVMLPTSHWKEVLNYILGCELVISSSLHGLILAESFGVPARWLRSSLLPSAETETVFKFNDYYASTNRSLDDWAESVDEALQMGGKEGIVDFDYDRLLNAFPHEKLEREWFYHRRRDRKDNLESRQPV